MSTKRLWETPIGSKFGKWETISEPFLKQLGKFKYWCAIARCECGKEREQVLKNLAKSKSNGCKACFTKGIFETHGLSKNPLYRIFCQMRSRCYKPSHKSYHNYGGRGIFICDGWLNDFRSFIKWAEDHGWEKGLDVDRRENDGPYSPDNCRIVPRKTNLRNTRRNHLITIDGTTKPLIEWCEARSIIYTTVCGRLNRGWSPKRALGMES